MAGLPFTAFDFFTYLVPGALVLAWIDYWFLNGSLASALLANQITATQMIVLFLIAYVLGQLNDSPAHYIIDKLLVEKVIGPPSKTLFGEQKKNFGLLKFFAPNYYVKLPDGTRGKVRERTKADADGHDDSNQRFVATLAAALSSDGTTSQLNVLVGEYSFCRNLAFASAVLAGVLLFRGMQAGHVYWLPFWLAVLGCVLMLGRFLRYYREHALVLFATYAAQQHGQALAAQEKDAK